MDELRDRIAEAIRCRMPIWPRPTAQDCAELVIDALGLHHVEGVDGEWRYVTAWQDTERPF